MPNPASSGVDKRHTERERERERESTSGSVSGAAFVLVAVEHAPTPVGRLPAAGPASYQLGTRSRLVECGAALAPQRRVGQHEPRSPLNRQELRVVCVHSVLRR